MPRRALTLIVVLAWHAAAHADANVARERFEQGLRAALEDRWEEAVVALEQSLEQNDKPATRFNLVLACAKLKRPLDVVRHASALLAQPAGVGREDARERAHGLLLEALEQLARLEIGALPQDATLLVDGRAPAYVDASYAYVQPGSHLLETRVGSAPGASVALILHEGEILPWPQLAPRAAPSASPPAPAPSVSQRTRAVTTPTVAAAADTISVANLRRRTAWSVGVVGAAVAVAGSVCFGLAESRADKLARRGIDGTSVPGYTDAALRYGQTLDAVMPLAFTGGALMAGALLIGNRAARRGSLATAIVGAAAGGALLGAGGYLLLTEPGEVIPTTGIARPSAQGGSLLFAAGLPLATYGVALLIRRRVELHVQIGSVSRLRGRW